MAVMGGWQRPDRFQCPALPVPRSYIFCLYPTATSRLSLLNLHNWVGLKLQQTEANWIFFLDCPEVKENCSILPNTEAHLVPRDLSQLYLTQQTYQLVEETVFPGTIVLLPGQHFVFLPLPLLHFFGWKTINIHPANSLHASPTTEAYSLPPELEEDELTDYLSLDPDSFHRKYIFPELSFQEFLCHVLPRSKVCLETLLTDIDEPGAVTGPLPPTLSVYVEESDKDDTEESSSASESENEDSGPEEESEKELEPPKKTRTLADVCREAAAKPSPPRPTPLQALAPFITVEKKNKSPTKKSPKKEEKPLRKVVKYAAQCPLMSNKDHKLTRCSYWHPRKQCEYYPKCFTGAEECGYGHPFCSEGSCLCLASSRNRQMNHRVPNSNNKALIE